MLFQRDHSRRERCAILYLLLAIVSVSGAGGATLVADPPIITECDANRLGRTTLSWDSQGVEPVQIRVLRSDGPAMTGLSPATGTASTGKWVTDGMLFFLVDGDGSELARTVVRVACGSGPALPSANSIGSYFPLRVGNQWIWRVSDRFVTSEYATWTVSRTEQVGQATYYVVTESGRGLVGLGPGAPARGQNRERWFRSDEQGRIYILSEGGQENLWLDPALDSSSTAVLATTAVNQTHVGPVGILPNAINFEEPIGLQRGNGVFARGVGLVSRRVDMLTGSSGGFVEGIELVYARIDNSLVLSEPEFSFGLSTEAPVLLLREGSVNNCALPCHFAACGLAGGQPDPPGTFKPCTRATATLRNSSGSPLELSFPEGLIFELELVNPAGAVVYRRSDNALPGSGPATLRVGLGETNLVQQVPLYLEPNQPLPEGRYTLQATLTPAQGSGVSASVSVDVRQ